MYIYLRENIVWEFVPEENPALPGVPLEERYPAEFIEALVYAENIEGIEYGFIYDSETGEFLPPPEPEPIPEPEPGPEPTPTLDERVTTLEAQLAETDEAAIELYEAGVAQEAINAEQDEAIIEIYELIGGITNG